MNNSVFDNKSEYKMSKNRLVEKVRRFANEEKTFRRFALSLKQAKPLLLATKRWLHL